MLESGLTRSAIARELRLSPSTVTRHARLLGYPDKRRRPSPRDWTAIQAHYDEGHSIDECRNKFGFSYAAWDKAVTRSDIVVRPRANGELAAGTRDQVEHLLSTGLTQAEIGRRLSLSKSTVAYHVRRLGRRADPRFARRYDWAEIQRTVDQEGLSMRQCLDRFGISRDSWCRAVRSGRLVPAPHKLSMEELLVAGRIRQRGHLKSRLVREGLKENRCERCGITEWLGDRLSMALHHVNGDGRDNRLANLQFLCPNCHSQTPNYGGRNGHRRKSSAGSNGALSEVL